MFFYSFSSSSSLAWLRFKDGQRLMAPRCVLWSQGERNQLTNGRRQRRDVKDTRSKQGSGNEEGGRERERKSLVVVGPSISRRSLRLKPPSQIGSEAVCAGASTAIPVVGP